MDQTPGTMPKAPFRVLSWEIHPKTAQYRYIHFAPEVLEKQQQTNQNRFLGGFSMATTQWRTMLREIGDTLPATYWATRIIEELLSGIEPLTS